MDSLVERKADLRGYIVGNGDRTKWRAWINGLPVWVDDPAEAARYGFRSDANAVHAEDEDAWCIVEYKDVATPSARIMGDKDRENPVEGAPYGEGLIGRIDALEAKNTMLSRALAYAQDRQISLMLERRALEARIAEQDRLLKLARELIAAVDQMAEDTAPIFAEMEIARGCRYQGRQIGPELEALRQALAAREQADATD